MESNAKDIRQEEQLNYLQKEFRHHVRGTAEAIRTIEARSVKRNEQMEKLDSKIDDILFTMNDSKYSTKKGVVTQTIDNSEKITMIQNELQAWRRAVVIIGAIFGGILLAGRYLWNIATNVIQNK